MADFVYIARSCGLSPNKIEEAWLDARFENSLKKYRQRAAALNIRGVPAYLFGKQMICGPRSIELRHRAW